MTRRRQGLIMRFVGRIMLLVCLVAALGGRLAEGGEGELTKETRACFDWWDGLGFPDIAKLPFVRIASMYESPGGGDPELVVHDHGFLLSEAAATFTVFSTDLRIRRFERTTERTGESERVRFEKVSLEAFVTTGLERIANPPKRGRFDPAPDPFVMRRWVYPNQSFRALVLARACAARRLPALAARLCELAVAGHADWRRAEEPPKDRYKRCREGIADEAFQALVERVSDAHWTHAQLSEAFRGFARAFPAHREAGRAEAVAETYAGWTSVASFATGGSWDVRLDRALRILQRTPHEHWHGHEQERSEEQVALTRFEAVPILLSCIGSEEPTRMVACWFSGKGQFRDTRRLAALHDLVVMLLRDVACGVLAEEWSDVPKTRDGRIEKFRARATAWWDAVRERGEADVLEERVASAGRGAERAAQRLLAVDPARGIRVLREAVAAAKTPYPAAGFIALIGHQPQEEATAALRAILDGKHGPRFRLEAARALHARGYRDAVPTMIAEWDQPSKQPIQEDVGLPADPGFSMDLIRFLAESRDARAYKALAERMAGLGVGWRVRILSTFLDEPQSVTGAEADALEALLAEQLGEDEGPSGVHMMYGGTPVDTRVGHVAARALAMQFPDRYRYDPRASARLRERMRHATRNAWRKKRGLKPLPPLVEKPVPTPLADEAVLPLLRRVRTATDEGERAKAARALEALGVAAVPALMRARAQAGDKDARDVLETLVSRQASIVTDIEVTKATLILPDALEAQLESIRNRPLDGAWYRELMLHVTRGTSEGVEGIRVRATRGDNLTGVTLRITVLDERHDDGMNNGGWSYGTPGGGFGISTLSHLQDPKAWDEEAVDLDHALSVSPLEDVVIAFHIVRLVER